VISVGYFALLCIGFALWIVYGISKGNLVLIVPNSAAFVVAAVTIAIALHFRRRQLLGARTTKLDRGPER
jgi:uncharacterized protein with PQ loop repeat